MKTQSSYNNLEKIFKKLNVMNDISGLIHWDMEVMMPTSALPSHIDKLQLLSKLHSRLIESAKVKKLISEAQTEKLDAWQSVNLKLMEKEHILAKAIPDKLNKALINATNNCSMVWRTARVNDDYKSFSKALKPVLNLTKEMAHIRGECLKIDPYDALIDIYDPGRKASEIDHLFAAIQTNIKDLLAYRLENQTDAPNLCAHYPIAAQKKLGIECMKDIGFDFNRGRLDISIHPFCSGSADDVRITTRYDTKHFLSALLGILHETGHALYEMNLPKAWRGQPLGSSLGMAIHESQSHFVEMQLAQSTSFMKYLQPKLHKYFPDCADKLTLQALHATVCYAERSLIRVEADELTYPLHIILRYNLEKLLIGGELQLEDLPTAWNEGMQDLLGIKPSNNADGCMQDIHWPSGSFGYFPSYTLGSMTAAQLANKCRKSLPKYDEMISSGDLKGILSWLSENIHQQASFHETANNLIISATYESLNPRYYLEHLHKKYG